MTFINQNLRQVLLTATAFAFILLIVGADTGASQDSIMKALCAVAVLGAMAITTVLTDRLSG